MEDETASADVEASGSNPEDLTLMIEDDGNPKQKIFNVGRTDLYWKKMPSRIFMETRSLK